MSAKRAVLEAMMAAAARHDHDAFLECWVDALSYHWSMHAPPVTSKAVLAKFLRNYQNNFEHRSWTVTAAAEDGDVLFVEGVEELYDRSRGQEIRNPFVQVITFEGGRIKAMRDYYDGSVVRPPESHGAQAAASAEK